MGEAIRGLPETPALSAAEGARQPDRIGAYLARQRRLRGLSLEELVVLTRIPRRSLERLEAGAFDADPDGFARGFVRTVARAIGLDPEETVARMLVEVIPERRGAERTVRASALALLAAVLVAALGVSASLLRSAGEEGVAPAADPAPRRHDFVRALAREELRPAAPGAH